MAKDHRLDLGRYISNPFNVNGKIRANLDFDELFRTKPDSGDYPWNPSRFKESDLTKRMMTRKRTLNPDLNFVSNSPFFGTNTDDVTNYELFEGLGRFERPTEYDFNEGRAITPQRPQDQPDFNPVWVEAYRLSPTVRPDKAAKNPMPRMQNPDPNGYLMSAAENRAENEMEGKMSIAQLLDKKGVMKPVEVKKEEKAGETTAADEAVEPSAPRKT
jgi:hypothetical protein